jgi:uncharacterized protein (TIGR02246 family)
MKSPVQFVAGAAVILVAAVLLGVPLAGLLPEGAVASPARKPDARDEIAQVVSAWAEAYRAGDARSLAGLYSEDAVSVVGRAGQHSGRAAILAAAKKNMDDFAFTAMLDVSEVELAGNTAWAAGELRLNAKSRKGGAPLENTGRYLAVFKRGADGRWRIHRDMHYRQPNLFPGAS